MRKMYIGLLVAMMVTAGASAQVLPVKVIRQPVVHCYADKPDPAFEAWIQTKIEERKTERVTVQSYIMPVIFHIIYDDGTSGSNLSQALIQQQILQLNKDYANQSNSPYAVAAKTGIQFVLAQKDASGNTLAEPGIERINRASRGFKALGTKGWTRDYIADTIKPATIWDPERYINVWLVPQMNNGGTGRLLGFSTFPISSTLDGLATTPSETAKTAGCVIDFSTVGSIYQPQSCDDGFGRGKTLTHELGHFFGLRHIWGDGTCATDYVDDTPTQEDANSGVPIHPKPDACGTPDEMFEDYMDYSNDEVLNTFTADQVDRMQVVMLHSPRRVNLPSSNVGFVTVSGSNKVEFGNCSGTITTTETGTTGTYPRYKDVSLILNAEQAATGAATVTVSVSGTATANQYQVMTPTLSFVKGDAYKPVVIRLFDNAAVDGDRELDVSYSISGTGVTAGDSLQSVTINVTDDDDIIFAGNDVITILNEKFESGSGTLSIPSGWASLISSGYPNTFVTSANGNAGGSGKAAHITNNTTTKPNTYTKGVSGAAELQSPEINPLQYQSIDVLKFKYKVRGSADDHGYALYDIGDGSLYFWDPTASGPYYGTSSTKFDSLSLDAPSALVNKKFNLAFYWEAGTAKTGGDPGFNIDDVSLTAHPYHIETAVASSFGYDVLAGSTNKFRSSNNKVVATVASASARISNITAAVSEAGNDKPAIVINGDTVNRTRKVITILPGTDNMTTSYTATFYFTSEEMAAWGTRAGTLRILKVKNGVSLSGNLSSSADAVIIRPSVINDRLSADGYITYTATITGFGQFALVDSTNTLPVFTFVSFSGILNGTTASLDWKTVDETNEAPFEVQRSTDSVSFSKIGSVTAKNTSSNEYTYNDANLTKGARYFYRIRQTDSSGNSSFSNVISFIIPTDTAATQWVNVYPNPVRNKLMLDFANTASQNVSIIVSDVSGRVLYRTQTAVAGHTEINTSSLSKAIYILKLQTSDHTQSFKILKE